MSKLHSVTHPNAPPRTTRSPRSPLRPSRTSALALACGILVASAPGAARAADAPSTVLLITLDGARIDLAAAPGGASPGPLARLAAEGIHLRGATSSSPLAFPGTASIFTGVRPGELGCPDDFAKPLGSGHATVAECFQRGGYRTAAFPGEPLYHRRSGLDRGFQRFEALAPAWTDDARVDSVVALVARTRARSPEKLFVWCSFTTARELPPWSRHRGTDARSMSEYRARAGRALEAPLARLREQLDQRGLLAQTAWIVVGTHGEAIAGGRLDSTPPEEDPIEGHGFDLSEESVRVPWILWGAGFPESTGARTIDGWVSTLDLLPTLAEWAGLPAPPDIDGASRWDEIVAGTLVARPVSHELDLDRVLHWSPRLAARLGETKLVYTGGRAASYALGEAAAASDGAPDAGVARQLADFLRREYGLDPARLRAIDRPDSLFGYEDEPIRLLVALRTVPLRDSTDSIRARYNRILFDYPGVGPALLERGVYEATHRQEKPAAFLLDSLTTSNPSYVEAEGAYGDHLITFQKSSLLETRLGSLSGFPLFEAERLWLLGSAQIASKKFADAEITFQLAAEVGTPMRSVFLRRRDLLPDLRQTLAEIEGFPDRMSAILRAAQLYADMEMYDESYRMSHKGRGLDGYDPEPEYSLGRVLLREGRPHHAAPALQRALEKDAKHLPARLALADAELLMGNWDSARGHLEIACAEPQAPPVAHYNLACLLARGGDVPRALDHLETAVAGGYANRGQIESDGDLAPLRGSARYAAILARLSTSP